MAEMEYQNLGGNGATAVFIDGRDSKLDGSGIAFSIHDSINDIFPTAELVLMDTTGLLTEHLMFVNGTQITLYLDKDTQNWKGLPLTVCENTNPNLISKAGLGTKIDLNLIHESFHNQDTKATSYEDNISSIVNKLAKELTPLTKPDVEDTVNTGVWVQPSMTNSDFIVKNLLPFCYSPFAEGSPFYAWIDCDNQFHLRSLNSLRLQKTVAELTYGAIITDENTITDVRILQTSERDYRPNISRRIDNFTIDGDYKKAASNDKLTSFPKNGSSTSYKADFNTTTKIDLPYVDEDMESAEFKNNQLGFKVNSIKDSLNIDKLIITTPLNRKLKAGALVKLHLPINFKGDNNNNNTRDSLRFSGNFLVESSTHYWNGRTSYSVCVVSKQDSNLL